MYFQGNSPDLSTVLMVYYDDGWNQFKQNNKEIKLQMHWDRSYVHGAAQISELCIGQQSKTK